MRRQCAASPCGRSIAKSRSARDAANVAARTAVAAIAGGTASMLSGGKFANGAITGAFAQLYNGEGGAERVNNWSSYGAAAGATTGGGLATAGCTAASGGGCALAAPETFAAGSLAGVPIGAGIGWAAANMANGIVDTANMVYDYVHGNSLASPRQTTVYQLTGPDGSIQKYGITSEGDPRDRYSAEFYRTTGVEMKILATYPYRLPARAHEFALCTAYVGAVGKLPPMSARC